MIKKLILGSLLIPTLLFSTASTESQLFDGVGKLPVFDNIKGDLTVVKERAKAKALRDAQLKARMFVHNTATSKYSVVTDDEISTILANVTEIRGEPKYDFKEVNVEGEVGLLVTCNLSAVIDDSNVLDAFKDRKHLEQSVQSNKEFESRRKLTEEEYEKLQKKYIETKDPSERKKIREQIEKNGSEFTAEQYFYSGNRFYHAKMYDEAISEYNKALKLDPKYSWAYSNRGAAYSDQGNLNQAMSDYNKAIELDPNNVVAYYNRGIEYSDQGNLDQAIRDYNKAIEINPNYYAAHNNRGNAYKKQGNSTQAMSDYNKAITIDPNLATAYYNRGLLYCMLDNNTQAMVDFNKAIELDPNTPEHFYDRGIVYYEQGNPNLAISDWTEAIEINPKYVEAYGNRGFAYYEQGNLDQAIKDCNTAIAINPQ